MESPKFVEFSRVAVLWKETGHSFPATIVAIENDGSYEVLYDEFVRNKPCFEKYVSSDRLSPLETHGKSGTPGDKSPDNMENQSNFPYDDGICHDLESNDTPIYGRPDIFEKVKEMSETYDFDNLQDVKLTNADILQLHAQLTSSKLDELMKENPMTLQFLNSAFINLLSRVSENQNAESSLPSIWESYSNKDSGKIIGSHFKKISDNVMANVKNTLVLAELVIRLHHHAVLSRSTSTCKNIHLSNFEDALKLSITASQQIVKLNLFQNFKGMVDESNDKTQSKSLKNSNPLGRGLEEMAATAIPILESMLSPMTTLLTTKRQSDVRIGALVDFCLLLFKFDTCSHVPISDVTIQIAIHNLQRCIIDVMSFVFKYYQSHRHRLLLDLLPMMAEIYGQKHVTAAFSFHHSITMNQVNGNSSGSVSMICALLLRILQSLVNTSDNDDGYYNSSKYLEDSMEYFQDPDNLSMTIPKETDHLNLWKQAFSDCRKYCALTVSELLKRCSQKEANGDYRVALTRLMDELFATLKCPLAPVSYLFMEVFIVLVRMEISNSMKMNTNESKRDTSYLSYLLDLLSSIGCKIRLVILSHQTNNSLTQIKENSNTAKALTSKLQVIRQHWEPMMTKLPKMSAKEQESSYGMQLKILSDVMRSYFSALAEVPVPHFDSDTMKSTPSVYSIIESFSSTDEWKSLLPLLPQHVDVEAFSVIEYLQNVCEMEKGSPQTQEAIKDAICLQLLYWLRYSSQKKNQTSFKYIEHLFQHFTFGQSPIAMPSATLPRFKLLFPVSNHKNGNGESTITTKLVSLLKSENTSESNTFFGSIEYMEKIFTDFQVTITLRDLFEHLLDILMTTLNDSSPIVRSRTVRAFHSFIRVDVNLFFNRLDLNKCIIDRLHDVAISVREETIKLVGYIVTLPSINLQDEATMSYLQAVRTNLNDTGISVRKAAVQIFRDLLVTQCNISPTLYVDLCITLLERWQYPKEESSIKEAVIETFQQLWFLPMNLSVSEVANLSHMHTLHAADNTVRQSQVFDGGHNAKQNITKGSPRNKSNSRNISIQIAFRLIEVVLETQLNQTWMVSLIREVLHTNDGESANLKSKRDLTVKHCSDIVEALVEILIKCEEGNTDDADFQYFVKNTDRSLSDIIVGAFLSLAVFCEAHAPLLLRRLPLLLPYLKPGKSTLTANQETIIFGKLCDMIASITILDGAAKQLKHLMPDVVQDLTNIVLKTSAANIHTGVKALSCICAHVLENADALVSLADKCFSSICMIAKILPLKNPSSMISDPQAKRIQRCLPVLGAVCANSRICNDLLENYPTENNLSSSMVTNQTSASRFVGSFEKLIPSAIHGCCYSAVCFALSLDDSVIQSQAVQTLCSVFLGFPKLIVFENSSILLRRILSEHFPIATRVKMLVSLKKILDLEETRLEENTAIDLMQESGVSIGDRVLRPQQQEGDTTVAGFVLQQYLSMLLIFLFDSEVDLRRATLGLIGTMLRQGMLCPLDVISHLVGLQADPEIDIRNEALKILQSEDQKRPNFIDNRMMEGIELGFILQMKLMKDTYATIGGIPVTSSTDNIKAVNGAEKYLSVFGPVYSSCLLTNRKRRNDMILGTLKRNSQILLCIDEYATMSPRNMDRKTASNASRMIVPSQSSSTTFATISNLLQLFLDHGLISSASFFDNAIRDETDISAYKLPLEGTKLLTQLSSFMISILAYLPFEYFDEPCQVIYWINRNISIASGNMMKNTRKCLNDIGLNENGDHDMQTTSSTSTAMIGTSNNSPRDRPDASSEYSLEVDMINVKRVAQSFKKFKYTIVAIRSMISRGLEGFLRLKSYLKVVHDISDEKCLSFRPDDKMPVERLRGFTEDFFMSNDFISFSPVPESAMDLKQLVEITLEIIGNPDIAMKDVSSDDTNNRNTKSKHKQSKSSEKADKDISSIFQNFIHAVAGDYNRVISLFENGADDFTLAVSKRKRKSTNIHVDIKDGLDVVADSSANPTKKKGKAVRKSQNGNSGKKRKKFRYSLKDAGEDSDLEISDESDNY